ncbi:hypothetical protein ACOMHN_055148 [Nucella lapillus]
MVSAERWRGRPVRSRPERFEDQFGRLRFACRNCGLGFTHMPNLRRHLKKCEGNYHLQCFLCQQQFYRRDLYQDHLKMKHGIEDVMKGRLSSSKYKRFIQKQLRVLRVKFADVWGICCAWFLFCWYLPVYRGFSEVVLDELGRPKHVCWKCGATFLHKNNLGRHRKKCEGNFHLSCPLCGQLFHRRDRYKEHLQKRHNALDSFMLRGTPRQLASRGGRFWRPGLNPRPLDQSISSLLLTTRSQRSEGGAHECRNCGKHFAYSHNMVRHRRKCEGTYHLQCPECGQQFNRKDVYNVHVRTKHIEPRLAREHNSSRTGSQSFLRPHQPFLDPGLAGLAMQYNTPHKQLGDVFTCTVCGSVITNRKNIARHRRKCEQKCHLQCQECGEQFHRRDYYQKHLWKAHLTQDPGPRRLLDDIAETGTKGSPSEWQRHHQLEEVVDDDVDVTEVLQGYVPPSSSSSSKPYHHARRGHCRSVGGPFDISALQAGSLAEAHPSSDIFLCPQTDIESFTCRVCGILLTNRKNAARHRRKCEKKCHLECHLCGQQFYRKDVYTKHMRTKHDHYNNTGSEQAPGAPPPHSTGFY